MRRVVTGALCAVALCALVAACGDGTSERGPTARTPEQVARGASERAFWTAFDAARDVLRTGDEAAAADLYESALERKPEHEAALYALAGIRWRQGRHVEALALAERLEAVERPKSRSLLMQARIRSDVDALPHGTAEAPWYDLDVAAAKASAALEINPEETGPHVVSARIALLRGAPADALASLNRALTLHPQHVPALILRFAAQRSSGDRAAARASLGRLLEVTASRDAATPEVVGDGDVDDGGALKRLERRRVLALLLRFGGHPWPEDAGDEPTTALLPGPRPRLSTPSLSEQGLRVTIDLDGDGVNEELSVQSASDADALAWLFGVAASAPTFRGVQASEVRAGDVQTGDDWTVGSGLDRIAACVGDLRAGDADGDGRPDVLALPRDHGPDCTLPALLMTSDDTGRFHVRPVRWAAAFDPTDRRR